MIPIRDGPRLSSPSARGRRRVRFQTDLPMWRRLRRTATSAALLLVPRPAWAEPTSHFARLAQEAFVGSRMMVFFYDATFEGLLSAVFDAYTGGVFPDALLRRGEILPLTAMAPHTVITRDDKVERVFRGLEKKLSPFALSGLLYASLAEDCGLQLFRYIRKVFDAPGSVERNLADPDVSAVDRLTRKVGREKQHLMGFARFQKTAQGVYLAVVEPRCNVLPLLVPHFQDRFGEQPWMLYDARRAYGIFCDGERCRQAYLDGELLGDGGLDPALLAEEEALFTRMWQQYFASAAVAERANPRLQARCLPRRFWKYLPEKR